MKKQKRESPFPEGMPDVPAPEPTARQRARDAVLAAQAEVHEALQLIANPPPLPATPAHNIVGNELRESIPPFAAEGPEVLSIAHDGTDALLWNCADASCTPEAFARLSAEEGLSAESISSLVAQIQQAGKEHAAAKAASALASGALLMPGGTAPMAILANLPAHTSSVAACAPMGAGVGGSMAAEGAGRPSERLVTLTLHVNDGGAVLRDRVVWDLESPSPTPEAFARSLCTELGVEQLQGPVARQVREQLRRLASGLSAEGDDAEGAVEAAPSQMVRALTEVEAWTPLLEWVDTSAAAAAKAEEMAVVPQADATSAVA